MNSEEVGAIGQVLGSIAVFVTLGYLAVRVRHAGRQLQQSLSQGRGEALRDLLMTRATDARLNGLYVKASVALDVESQATTESLHPFVAALMQRAGMNEEDATALMWDQSAWWAYRIQHIPYLDDLPVSQRIDFDRIARRTYGSTFLDRLWYEKTKSFLDPAAVAYIDKLLAQPG